MTSAMDVPRDVPTDAELEPVVRAIMLLRTPEYADDALWAEHWKWFLDGRNDATSCVHLSHQGIALRQARAAVQAWQAARVVAAHDADGWIPIDQWTPEHGETVMGYWQYRDQAGRLTEGWEVIQRTERGWEDWDGLHPAGFYTHFKPLSRPKGVTP